MWAERRFVGAAVMATSPIEKLLDILTGNEEP